MPSPLPGGGGEAGSTFRLGMILLADVSESLYSCPLILGEGPQTHVPHGTGKAEDAAHVCWLAPSAAMKHPLHARPHLAALHTFWHACGLQHLCYATQKYPQPPKAANFMLEVGEQFCVVNKRYSSPASWLS